MLSAIQVFALKYGRAKYVWAPSLLKEKTAIILEET